MISLNQPKPSRFITWVSFRASFWNWSAIVLAVLLWLSVSWLHFQQQQEIQQVTQTMDHLRLARLDLYQGLLHVTLANTPGAPYNREQGVLFFNQAIMAYEENLSQLQLDQEEEAAVFKGYVQDLNDVLRAWEVDQIPETEKSIRLRIVFHDVDQSAARLDQLGQKKFRALVDQFNRQFAVVLVGSSLLLLGICLLVFFAGRYRERVEKELRESEAKFRALFEENRAPMMLVSPDNGEIVDCNLAAASFYGWTRAEMVEKKVSDINILSPAEIKAEMARAVAEQRQHFQFQHRLANRKIRDVEVFSGPIRHQGRTVLYSIIYDITAQKRAEMELEESKARYRDLFNAAPLGVAVVSAGKVRLANAACARLVGEETAEQMEGKTLEELIHPAGLASIKASLTRLSTGEAGVFPTETILQKKNGAPFSVEMLATPISSVDRNTFQVILTDITARKKAEAEILAAQRELEQSLSEAEEARQALTLVVAEQRATQEQLNQLNAELERRVYERTVQLEAANKELEAFSYSVSHDLRAPLRGIDGWSQALLEDYGERLDENGRTFIHRVRGEAHRMGELIDDLLRLSRVTRMEMRFSEVNLSALAGSIMKRLGEEDSGREIEAAIQPGVMAKGDANLLEIVLTNLLSNARKFTGRQPHPRIEFGATTREQGVVYFVRDNGAGFDMDHAKNLFGAFQRMHKQTEFPGTGIGLATVQRIIHRHGGEVWAEAQKNVGATFYFTLSQEV